MTTNFNFERPGYVYTGNFNFGYGGAIYNILLGSNNFTSVWADPNANINNAKLYIGSSGTGASFSVIDLNNRIIIDSYTLITMGANEEFLDGEDIVDINVSTAGA